MQKKLFLPFILISLIFIPLADISELILIEDIKGANQSYQEFVHFDKYNILLGPLEGGEFPETKEVRGSIVRTIYTHKEENIVNVFEHFITELNKNNFEILYKVEGNEGGSKFNRHIYSLNPVHYDRNGSRSYPFTGGSNSNQYYIVAKHLNDGDEVFVTVNINIGWFNYPVYRIDFIHTHDEIPDMEVAFADDLKLPVKKIKNSSQNYQEIVNMDKYNLILGPVVDGEISEIKNIEGSIIRSFYRFENQSAYGIYMAYLRELDKQGFEILYKMEGNEGGSKFKNIVYSLNPVDHDRNGSRSFPFTNGSNSNQYYITAVKTLEEKEIYFTFNINHGWHSYPYLRVDIIKTDAEGPNIITADEIERSIQERGRIEMYGILFDSGSYRLRKESRKAIDLIADFIEKNPDKNYYIVGHTDMRGSIKMNMELSQGRAESVLNFLISNFNVNKNRVQAKGVGPLYPVASNQTEEGRQLNRRVELVCF
ncbi:MAG: OmpA family protein [Candidatus Muiribacteriota bacterium]